MATIDNSLVFFTGGHTPINDSLVFFIGGHTPKPTLSCPALDPAASIQITDDLIGVYQESIDALINQLGKNIYLEFDPEITECPNCWTKDAMVLTNYGYKQIQNINIGDIVISPSGNNCYVTGKYQSLYEGQLFNFKCAGISLPQYVTSDHKFPIIRGFRKKYDKKNWLDKDNIPDISDQIEHVKAKDIEIGDGMIVPFYDKHNSELKNIFIDGFGDIDCSDELLYLFGWFIAEGFVSKSKYPRVIDLALCASKEEDIANKLIEITKNIFGLTATKSYAKNADTVVVHIYSSKLAKFFMNFGILAPNKHVPICLYNKLSTRQKGILFEAYHCGDGHIDKSQKLITTTSITLAFQIFQYLSSIDLLPAIRFQKGKKYKDNINHKDWWSVVWVDKNNRKMSKINIKKTNIGYVSIIRKITTVYDKCLVYNIQVENDHSYIANGVGSDNCTVDHTNRRSTGIYKINGPIPFARGRKCPFCKGEGLLQTPVQKCIKALLQWRPKDLQRYGINVNDYKAVLRIKTFLSLASDLIRAKYIIANHDIENNLKLKVKMIRSPVPAGLREDRYCISFWELIDS